MKKKLTAIDIANAWHGVTDEWVVRRNKSAKRQWEVVHNWGGDLISDETMKVVGRFSREESADAAAMQARDIACGTAVLELLNH